MENDPHSADPKLPRELDVEVAGPPLKPGKLTAVAVIAIVLGGTSAAALDS